MTRVMYDAAYTGWQTLQLTVPNPVMLGYGTTWTGPQIATIPSTTIKIPIDTDGSHASTTVVADVEGGMITTASVAASWINARNALPGGYAVNRPTLYMAVSGSYYKGAGSDVITPLASTYGLVVGTDYDLWLADATGTLPGSPIVTNGVACVATQYRNYTQNGASYDTNVVWDSTWNPGNIGSVKMKKMGLAGTGVTRWAGTGSAGLHKMGLSGTGTTISRGGSFDGS